MELEGIMLSEISQTEKDKYCMISFVRGIKKADLRETETKVVLTRGWGKWEDVGQRVHTSSYTMNKFWGSNLPPCCYYR